MHLHETNACHRLGPEYQVLIIVFLTKDLFNSWITNIEELVLWSETTITARETSKHIGLVSESNPSWNLFLLLSKFCVYTGTEVTKYVMKIISS
jgi:hypothetical protein